MERARWAEVVGEEADVLLAAATADLEAACQSCPEWTAADLLRHVGGVHRRFTRSVAERRTERPPRAEAPDDVGLADWFAAGVDALVTVLRSADDLPEVWTWAGQRPVSWVARRMAHETAVHRWDAQTCTGASDPLEATLASDAVDEYLGVFVPVYRPGFEGDSATLRVATTDTAGEWFLAIAEEAPTVADTGRAVASIAGPASEVALALWGRVHPGVLEVTGDDRVVTEWLTWLAGVRR